jgi:hypothetical protein
VEVGGFIMGGRLIVETGRFVQNVRMSCLLAGIRRGFAGRRFVKRSKEDFHKNLRFWGIDG